MCQRGGIAPSPKTNSLRRFWPSGWGANSNKRRRRSRLGTMIDIGSRLIASARVPQLWRGGTSGGPVWSRRVVSTAVAQELAANPVSGHPIAARNRPVSVKAPRADQFGNRQLGYRDGEPDLRGGSQGMTSFFIRGGPNPKVPQLIREVRVRQFHKRSLTLAYSLNRDRFFAEIHSSE